MPGYYGGKPKPTNPIARVNRSHRLADGLLECVPFAMPLSYADALDPTQKITTTSFTLVFDEGAGYGLKCTGNSPNIIVPSAHNITAGDFTIQFVFKPNLFNTGFSYTAHKGGEFQLFYSTAGNVSLISLGGADATGLSSTSALQAGVVAIIHITRSGSSGLLYSYGKKDGAFTSSGTTPTVTGIVMDGNGGRGAAGGVTFISWMLWNKALSPTDIAELAFDPYAMLRVRTVPAWAGAAPFTWQPLVQLPDPSLEPMRVVSY